MAEIIKKTEPFFFKSFPARATFGHVRRIGLIMSIVLLWLGASPRLHALRTSPALPDLHTQEPTHEQSELEFDVVVYSFECTCSEKPVYRRMVIAISGMRYFNQITGTWISRDPIGEQGGLNLYGFVGDDPANKLDFLGLDCLTCESGEPIVPPDMIRPSLPRMPFNLWRSFRSWWTHALRVGSNSG